MKLTAFQYGKTEISQRMAFQNGDMKTALSISLMFFLLEQGERKMLIDVGYDTMPGFLLYEFDKPVNLLRKYGVIPNEITDVLITHSHHDHIGCLHYYQNNDIYIQEGAVKNAKKYLSATAKLYTFKENINISDGIRMKHIGGHSVGSSIVLINTGSDTYVLCGDECYTKENLSENKPTGSSCCLEKSFSFIQEYRKECYKNILFHDPMLVGKLGYKTIIE